MDECKPLVTGGTARAPAAHLGTPTSYVAALLGAALFVLGCAFLVILTTPKMAPWALDAVKSVTVTAVIGCVAGDYTRPRFSST